MNTYGENFKKMMKCQNIDIGLIRNKQTPQGFYPLPNELKIDFSEALAKNNIFRRLSTVVSMDSPEGTLYVTNSNCIADWNDNSKVVQDDDISKFDIKSHKLTGICRLDEDFVYDTKFDIESYLINTFAKRFGKSEENAFLNGNGIDIPTGLLNYEGAVTGVSALSDKLSYDDIVKLYFSLDAEFRENAVFIMHDDTAMFLRTIKDSDGYPIFNSNNNTIFGKPVETSCFMPKLTTGVKAILFGDFSYHWIIERQPFAVKCLNELYAEEDLIGYLGNERLDSKIINSDAIKVLSIGE